MYIKGCLGIVRVNIPHENQLLMFDITTLDKFFVFIKKLHLRAWWSIPGVTCDQALFWFRVREHMGEAKNGPDRRLYQVLTRNDLLLGRFISTQIII